MPILEIYVNRVIALFNSAISEFAIHAFVIGAVTLTSGADAAPIAVPPTPQRIVSLSAHTTELLFSAGLGDRVVAVSEACDFPERAKTLPKVANYRGTNVEAVLALKPDLVVVWPGGNKASDIAAIERLGVRVFRSEMTRWKASQTPCASLRPGRRIETQHRWPPHSRAPRKPMAISTR